VEAALSSFIAALGQTYVYLWQMITGLEGDSLLGIWSFIMQQVEQDRSARILWPLIMVLAASGAVFILCLSVLIGETISLSVPRKRHEKKVRSLSVDVLPASRKENQKKIAQTVSWAKKNTPHSILDKLKAGQLEAVEKSLSRQWKKQPDDVGLMLYWLACRAMQCNAKSYGKLVATIFPDGLKAEVEICRHAADIGRLLAPEDYPLKQIPQPDTAFEVEMDLLAESLRSISEFGSVQTLLDLIRVYYEMGDFDQITHLIVEVLVCGTTSERELAMKFAKRIQGYK